MLFNKDNQFLSVFGPWILILTGLFLTNTTNAHLLNQFHASIIMLEKSFASGFDR